MPSYGCVRKIWVEPNAPLHWEAFLNRATKFDGYENIRHYSNNCAFFLYKKKNYPKLNEPIVAY